MKLNKIINRFYVKQIPMQRERFLEVFILETAETYSDGIRFSPWNFEYF